VSDAARDLRQKVSDVSQRAADTVDEQRFRAAGGLDTAADRLNQSGDGVRNFARGTADKLGATADYLRNHDARDIVDDVKSFAKAHPTQALVGAVALGFLAGRLFRRN
jgi:ElaB/YqjD/DUF883 family membrane-anchored ribosome-binding protein